MYALLDWLIDEFDLIATRSAMRHLGSGIALIEQQLDDAGVGPPRERHVEQETQVETLDALLGAAFVVGQTLLNLTLKRLVALRLDGAAVPVGRLEILRYEGNDVRGIPDTVAVDALANYFKHSSEWSAEWQEQNGLAAATIGLVRQIGLRPRDRDNMRRAANDLGFQGSEGPGRIVDAIMNWRRRCAGRIAREQGLELDT